MKLLEEIHKNHIKYITEWKSVSDDVIRLSEYISNAVLEDIEKCNQKIKKVDGINYILFYSNQFKLKLPQFNNIENKIIKVNYTFYDVKNEFDKTFLNRINVSLNSEWNESNDTMILVGILENGIIPKQFLEDITHEVEHMFQYSMGMNKREMLYDKMVDIIKNNTSNKYKYFVALALYYTFKHEQDSFTQQFYKFLNNNKDKIKDFDNALESFDIYNNIENAYYAAYDLYDNKESIETMNELGYSRRDYYKRLNFSYKRLIKKFENAYVRFSFEKSQRSLKGESIIKNRIHKMSKLIELSEGNSIKEKLDNLLTEDLPQYIKRFYN